MFLGKRVLQRLLLFRVLYAGGVFGSGKTLACVALAWELKRRYGYRVWSNIPVAFADEVVVELPLHTVVLLDEGRRYVDSRSWQKNQLSLVDYARHMDAIFLFPAAFDVDVRLRRFECRRLWPWLRFGDGAWLYSFRSEYDQGWPAVLGGPAWYFGSFGQVDGKGVVTGEGDQLYYLLTAIMQHLGARSKAQEEAAEVRVSEAEEAIGKQLAESGLV